MKHRRIFLIGFIVVLFVVVIVTAAAIISNSRDNKEEVKVYFLNPVTNELVYETRKINIDKEEKMIEAVMTELRAGPKSTANLVNTMPEGVEFNYEQCKFSPGQNNINTLYVSVSDEEGALSSSGELLLKGAVIWSLTELDFVSYVDIKINDRELGRFNRDNVEVNPSISPDKIEIKEVTLYFADENAMYLCSEKRAIEVAQSQTVETKIVEQLIEGPKEEGHYATVPSETQIKNIKSEDGICYVDLSRNFVEKHNGGTAMETLTIYSIVNSLTELSTVSKVQFLIEGQKEEEFKGHLDFSKPFERNEELIEGINTEKTEVSLYFPDVKKEGLICEKRVIDISGDKSVEMQIAENLIAGPEDEKSCTSVIPPDSRVLDVKTVDGICTISFNGEFYEDKDKEKDSVVSMLKIYSVVNSLTELDNIDKVQFLIENNKPDRIGDFLLAEPVERNEDLIKAD